jgi:uncharacterized protein (TIGR03437 family)
MRLLARLLALLTLVSAAGAQCLSDAQGNSLCVTTQDDANVCGYPIHMFGRPITPTYACHDIVVTKTAPDGHAIYRRAFGGSSEDTPGELFLDAQGNAAVIGTTWSRDFPITAGAAYAGPAPSIGTGYPLSAGGDVFAAAIDSDGKLAYATLLGSSGNDTIIGLRDPGDGTAQALVSAAAGDFPVTSAAATPRSGPVLLTFDLNHRVLAASRYLPIDNVEYLARLRENGDIAVTTRTGLYTFDANGALRSFAPIDWLGFRFPPSVSIDAANDVWLVGAGADRIPLVAKLTNRLTGVFQWRLPVDPAGGTVSLASLSAPFFGPDGLAYVSGNADLQSATPNALLAMPCTYSSIVAVLSPQGEVKVLSYLPHVSERFVVDEQGGVSLIMTVGGPLPVDLSLRPKAGCVQDVLRPYSIFTPFGAGQVVRLRGGGFGPDAPVTVTVDGIAAPVLSTSPGEAVFAIPWAVRESDAVPVTIAFRGETSRVLPVAVRQIAPAVVEPVFNADGTSNRFDHPAAWGSTVTIYLTGAGHYTPPIDDGQSAPLDATHSLAAPVSVAFQIGAPESEPGKVLYAGPAPGYVGLAQINVQLPPAQPRPSDYSAIGLVVTIGDVRFYAPIIYVK